MKNLEFPFQDSIELSIQTGNRKKRVICELASSEIEIFQSLTKRSKKDFKIPLVLLFKNPLIQSFSIQGFNFPLEQYCIDKYGAEQIYETHHYEDADGFVVNSDYPMATPISNIDYETDQNETKRRVRILKPSYLSGFVSQFDKIINA